MTTAIPMRRWLACTSAAVLALAFALSLTPRAGAGSSSASTIDVVGSGTIVWHRLSVLAEPKAGAKRLAVLKQFRTDFRPQYVLALDVLRGKKTGKPTWYRISIPGRPNGRTGWVRAGGVEIHPVQKRLIVYRGAKRFEFWDGVELVRAGKVAVGKRGAETPVGLFYVTWKFNPSIDPEWAILGAYAFETSAYSKLTDWPGGGIVGMHGTPWPWLLGQAVSHGCIRIHNDNIEFLRNRVPLGTPVKIVR
jgi:lipoprotein-anchoring transpeptidase ErfK/SrfK